jgi:hypothetical protein
VAPAAALTALPRVAEILSSTSDVEADVNEVAPLWTLAVPAPVVRAPGSAGVVATAGEVEVRAPVIAVVVVTGSLLALSSAPLARHAAPKVVPALFAPFAPEPAVAPGGRPLARPLGPTDRPAVPVPPAVWLPVTWVPAPALVAAVMLTAPAGAAISSASAVASRPFVGALASGAALMVAATAGPPAPVLVTKGPGIPGEAEVPGWGVPPALATWLAPPAPVADSDVPPAAFAVDPTVMDARRAAAPPAWD